MEADTNLQRVIIAAAFRSMARGVEAKAAYASTLGFYRASGREWAKSLA